VITALIFDDEESARDYLGILVRKYLPFVTNLFSTGDPAVARNYIGEYKPNIVFLDVEMGNITGFEFLESLKERNFEVVFTTAFSKYAIQAIRFSAIDFLLKPVQPDELINSFNRFMTEPVEASRRLKHYSHLFRNLKAADEKNLRLSLKRGNNVYFISPRDIYWCRGESNYTRLCLKDATEFLVPKTLKEFEDMFLSFNFIRVHKSALVNLDHFSRVHNNCVVLTNNVSVEISRRRMKDVMGLLAGR
jgi:two-component system LytT family response regulator